MTYTGAPCGAHLSEFDVDRSSDGNGERRSAYTPKVVRRWEIGAPKRFDCADFMEPPSKLLANGHLTSVGRQAIMARFFTHRDYASAVATTQSLATAAS
jgi:hypothetical protein